ncbi:hypothetical protein SASPL_153100 [Salvia splendens]|uniref:Uncharacterized protein n=1 Tax=Salvia splendens TaxID=180675 RepID=A0A8X8W4F5_SALSN|nr:uncharacterized protein LOC121783408 isoform X1 [Salvia splendens]XP_042037402.1 uncharacterized protein LOC121783408 isoform X1 [Salvia splendens]XP_042037403.1 uncharacterized protein LOC121783408 isoform X2 [Salvia splendens]KAG6387905.1 hypothetical protein SASPL_153100 [Salvia splendens]
MKRASVNFDQSHSASDEAKDKLKYQTLLREYLDLQKVFVSKKRKLQAAKQKREVVFAEVRFLRRKHKYLLKRQAPNTDKETNALQGGGNPIPSTIDQPLLSNSLRRDGKAQEGKGHVYQEDVRCKKRKKNPSTQDKAEGEQKICWPDQVTPKF